MSEIIRENTPAEDVAFHADRLKSVHEALAWVMERVGYVQKQRSPTLNYSYAGEEGLIDALRDEIVAAGLVLTVHGVELLKRGSYQTAKGSTMVSTVVRLDGRWTHWPSGTSADVCAVGEGADVGDKSCPKAMTGAYKYILRETFLIKTGDDPDKDASVPRGEGEAWRGYARPTAAEAPRSPQEAPRPAAPAHGPAEVRRGQGGAQGKGGPNQGCPDCGAQGRTPKNFDAASNRPDLYCPNNCPGDEKKDGRGRWARAWWSFPKGTAPAVQAAIAAQAPPPGRDSDIPFGGDGGDPDAWRAGPPQEW